MKGAGAAGGALANAERSPVTLRLAPLGILVDVVACSVPPSTVTSPAKLLLPDRIAVPEPVILKSPLVMLTWKTAVCPLAMVVMAPGAKASEPPPAAVVNVTLVSASIPPRLTCPETLAVLGVPVKTAVKLLLGGA